MNEIVNDPGLPVWAELLIWVGIAVTAEVVQRKTIVHFGSDADPRWATLWFSLRRPLTVSILIVLISIIALRLLPLMLTGHHDWLASVAILRNMSLLIMFGWFCMRFADRFIRLEIDKALEHNNALDEDDLSQRHDISGVEALGKAIQIAVAAITSLLVLQQAGLSLSALWGVGGVGGIVIGFGAKEAMANFIGGISILYNKSFAVGDWIHSSDRQIEGTVENISFLTTTVRTFDKRPLTIPNSLFNSIVVTNAGRMTNRRIYEQIPITTPDVEAMRQITRSVKTFVESHSAVDAQQTLIVNHNGWDCDGRAKLMVYAILRTTNWVRYHGIKQHILLEIQRIIEEHLGSVSAPRRELSLNAAAIGSGLSADSPLNI